ncbi:MAG: hypothetical protein M3P96_00385, partial [Actinomycetota bacterium]|nr:hypothetical protein [Actinomycetota bacterium]
VALLAPRLRGGAAWTVAALAVLVALLLVPVAPVGVPVLAAALVAVAVGFLPHRPAVPRAGS